MGGSNILKNLQGAKERRKCNCILISKNVFKKDNQKTLINIFRIRNETCILRPHRDENHEAQ